MSAKSEAKKDQLIADLIAVRKQILDEARSFSPQDQDKIFLGVWSVQDLLAHLIGWDFTNKEAVKEILSDKLPAFYARHDRDWKTYNAGLVARYTQDNFVDLLASVKSSHQQLIDFLKTIPAEEFNKDRGIRFRGYKVTIERLLQAEARDEGIHHLQLVEFREKSGQ